MSIIALGLTLCNAFTCNTYFIDKADTMRDCNHQYIEQSNEFVRVWNDISSPLPLKEWFAKQNIDEEPASVISYRFECVALGDGDIQ